MPENGHKSEKGKHYLFFPRKFIEEQEKHIVKQGITVKGIKVMV